MALGPHSTRASETALAVLMFTSIATSEESTCTPFNDPIGPRLLSWRDGKYSAARVRRLHQRIRRSAERSDPGAYGFMLARTLYIDDLIRREVGNGLEQLVILGAGYDTRAMRMPELAGVDVIEIDHPATSRDKRHRVLRSLGDLPANVTYLEVDFTRQTFLEALARAAPEPQQRSLFVLSGVSMYLPEAEFVGVLSQVAEHRAVSRSIVFDYLFEEALRNPREHLGAAQFVARATNLGEEPKCALEPDRIKTLFGESGLDLTEECGPPCLSQRYLRRTNGATVAPIVDFAAVVHAAAATDPGPG